MNESEDRYAALQRTYERAKETGEEEACEEFVTRNDFDRFKESHPDAVCRWVQFKGTGGRTVSGSRTGRVKILVPDL
jgi:hypothetical protein